MQMPLPWGQILVTNPLQIPTCCPTWGGCPVKTILQEKCKSDLQDLALNLASLTLNLASLALKIRSM